MLHILNQSPFTSENLKSCLKMLREGDVILLIEDAVYACATDCAFAETLVVILEKNKIFVLEPDIEARGLMSKIITGITLISYEDFVDLTINHYPTQSWSNSF